MRARLATRKGLQSLLIAPDDFRRAWRLKNDDCLIFKDVPALLAINEETAWAALRVGLIVEKETDDFGVLVTRASVEEFARNYVTALWLVRLSKKSQLAVHRRLAEAGVSPVLSKAIHPRCKMIIYRLADIPAEILTELTSPN